MYDEPPDPEPNPCPYCEAELGHGEGCDHCALASKLGSAESELSTLKHRLACRARWVAHTPFDALPSSRALEAIALLSTMTTPDTKDLIARLRAAQNASWGLHPSAAADAADALDSQAAELANLQRLSCGHPAELMQYSAETGAPLYCELCDDKSGRRDAERREMELQAELAALRASAASVQADQRDSLRYRIWREHFTGATSCEISGLMIALADSWTPEAVDAAIDAALAAKGEGAPPAPGGAA